MTLGGLASASVSALDSRGTFLLSSFGGSVRHTFLCVAFAVCTVAAHVSAQDDGGFSGGRGGSGLPTDINLPRTIPQQFSIKLKLDRTQQPDVDKILTAANTEAAPSTQEMLQARQRLLNALRGNRAEEAKAAEEAYATAAAKGARVEAAAFGKVYALLKPNQHKDAPAAFALLAGLFANTPAPGARGGPGGGRGGAFPFSRFELLVENFKLEGDKKKAVKTAVDDAHKSAAAVREALLAGHAALGVAVAGGAAEAIESAVRAYATQAAAMAHIEMDALSRVIGIADPELQNPPAVQAAFYMARGMFLRGKWDEIPDRNQPSY